MQRQIYGTQGITPTGTHCQLSCLQIQSKRQTYNGKEGKDIRKEKTGLKFHQDT